MAETLSRPRVARKLRLTQCEEVDPPRQFDLVFTEYQITVIEISGRRTYLSKNLPSVARFTENSAADRHEGRNHGDAPMNLKK